MKKTYIAPKAICVNIEAEELIAESIGMGGTTTVQSMETKGQSMWSFGGDQDITSSNAWSDDEDW